MKAVRGRESPPGVLLFGLCLVLSSCALNFPGRASRVSAELKPIQAPQKIVLRGRVTTEVGAADVISKAGLSRFGILQMASHLRGSVILRGATLTEEKPLETNGRFEFLVDKSSFQHILEADIHDGRGSVTRGIRLRPVPESIAVTSASVSLPELVAKPTGTIEGVVRSEGLDSQTGFSSVQIFLASGVEVVCSFQSDGHFTISHVPEGTWNVVFTRSGFEPQTVRDVQVTARRATTLAAPVELPKSETQQADVTGLVSLRGTGGNRALVKLYPLAVTDAPSTVDGVMVYTALTDEQGRYHFYGLSPGTYSLEVYASRHRIAPRRTILISREQMQELETISLTQPTVHFATLSGTVRNSQENAIGGAFVQLDPPVTEGQNTDTAGRFTLTNVLPGSYQLVVSAGGYRSSRQAIIIENRPQFHAELHPPITLETTSPPSGSMRKDLDVETAASAMISPPPLAETPAGQSSSFHTEALPPPREAHSPF